MTDDLFTHIRIKCFSQALILQVKINASPQLSGSWKQLELLQNALCSFLNQTGCFYQNMKFHQDWILKSQWTWVTLTFDLWLQHPISSFPRPSGHLCHFYSHERDRWIDKNIKHNATSCIDRRCINRTNNRFEFSIGKCLSQHRSHNQREQADTDAPRAYFKTATLAKPSQMFPRCCSHKNDPKIPWTLTFDTYHPISCSLWPRGHSLESFLRYHKVTMILNFDPWNTKSNSLSPMPSRSLCTLWRRPFK